MVAPFPYPTRKMSEVPEQELEQGKGEEMSKREEIREGIAKRIKSHYGSIQHINNTTLEDLVAGYILELLHSQGVVIKVERDLVNTTSETEVVKSALHKAVDAHINNESTFIELMDSVVKAGYKATVPLIEEVKDGEGKT